MKKKIMLFLLLTMGITVCVNAVADAAQDTAVKKGREHYKIFCMNCHGVNTDGKGKLVSTLKIMPYDLTVLNQTGDLCITERVLKAVIGLHDVTKVTTKKDHDMPVFSGNLESITIYELSQYLKSIQK